MEDLQARLLLGDRPIAQLAADQGCSEDELNRRFFERVRVSPAQYRALRGVRRWSLALPPWLCLDSIFRYWGRDPAGRSERSGDRKLAWSSHTKWGPLRIDGELQAAGQDRRLHLSLSTVDGQDPAECSAAYAHGMVLGFLGLHNDPRPFEAGLENGPDERLIDGRRGMTVPQTASVFDAALWVVVGQQVSLAAAFSIRRRLTERFGTAVGDLLTPPSVMSIAEASLEELHGCGLTRRKSEYLRGLAQRATDDESAWGVAPFPSLESWRRWTPEQAQNELLAIRGFGAWSAGYMQMRALGFADCVPLGDAALRNALARYFELPSKPDRDRTEELMERFRPHRSLATFHLWASLADPQ